MFTAKVLSLVCIISALSGPALGQNSGSMQARTVLIAAAGDVPTSFTGETSDERAFLYHSSLLLNDTTMLSTFGEKKLKLRRADILKEASNAIRPEAERSGDSASADRFLSCVAQAMIPELHLKTSIFDVKSIITTYERSVKKPLYSKTNPSIKVGIEAACNLLMSYHDKLKVAIDPLNADLLKQKKGADLPSKTWYDTQVEHYTQKFPTEVAENNIIENQQRNCFFAVPCPPEYGTVAGRTATTPTSSVGGIKR